MMKLPADDFLLDLKGIIDSALVGHSEKSTLVTAIIAGVVNNWGGLQPYIRKNEEQRTKNSERDLVIYRRFNGHNKRLLCSEFAISESYLYEIVRRAQTERQCDLFVENDDE